MPVEIAPGATGQFDVFVGAEVIASKRRVGLIDRFFGSGGFPGEAEAIAAVKAKLGA